MLSKNIETRKLEIYYVGWSAATIMVTSHTNIANRVTMGVFDCCKANVMCTNFVYDLPSSLRGFHVEYALIFHCGQ